MDYLSHGFWSYIFFHKTKAKWLAVLFGLLPDSMSWFVYFIYRLIYGGFGRPILSQIPDWTFMLYNVSHSLIVAFVIILIVFMITNKFPYYMLAWPFAITMDLFTHSAEFLPTPFLWPVSNYVFDGVSWGTPIIFFGNWILIIGFFVWYRYGKN